MLLCRHFGARIHWHHDNHAGLMDPGCTADFRKRLDLGCKVRNGVKTSSKLFLFIVKTRLYNQGIGLLFATNESKVIRFSTRKKTGGIGQFSNDRHC
jgi:hypothetical protein